MFIKTPSDISEVGSSERKKVSLSEANYERDGLGNHEMLLGHQPLLMKDTRLSRLENMKAKSDHVTISVVVQAGDLLDSRAAARRAGVSIEALYKRSRRGALIGIRNSAGRLAFPAFQFESAWMMRQIQRVVARLPIEDPWNRIRFLLTETPDLDGKSPLEAIRQGRIADAERAARAFYKHQVSDRRAHKLD